MLALFAPLFWFYASRVGRILLENHNEGWNALFTDRAMQGGALYPGPGEMVLNNYPPLSFYIVGQVGRLMGSAIDAGRLVSCVALLVTGLLVGVIVGNRTRCPAAGAFAAAFFLLLFACFPGERLGLNDPQLLGHAVMTAGLAVLWLAPNRPWSVLAAAALMVVAGLIKHNIVAAPLAATAWMAWRGRRSLALWLGAAALAGSAGLGLVLAVWGSQALHSMLGPRSFSLFKLAAYPRQLMALLDIPLACWALITLGRDRSADAWFATFLVLASLSELLLFAGGSGVVANVAYDLLIALALSLGLAAGRLERPRETAALVGVLLFYFALALPVDRIRAALVGDPRRALREANVKADIEYMNGHKGPALCFDMALCWYAHRPVLFDQFMMGELFALRLRPVQQLTDHLAAKDYAVIQVPDTAVSGIQPALPPPALAALQANYVADRRTEDRVFFIRRP